MDGNGRWAKQRGLPRYEGHRRGAGTAQKIVEECRRLGIKYLTLYTFSKENWSRPKEEIAFLFDLLKKFLQGELNRLIEQDIRLNILGELKKLPLGTRQVAQMVCAKTRNNQSMHLNLALNYSGRAEIVRACKLLMQENRDPDSLTEDNFKDYLYTKGQPDPDLIIRTSGELRISNYLLYQSAYAELYFTPVLWPDFSPEHLHAALEDYAGRKRRFGRVEGVACKKSLFAGNVEC
jgi:undecaprenyl diphosphate synthase